MKKIKLNNYAITITAAIALVLIFGFSLTSGATLERKKNDQTIFYLSDQIGILEDKLNLLEKNQVKDQKQIKSLKLSVVELKKGPKTTDKTTFSNSLLSSIIKKPIVPAVKSVTKPSPKKQIVNYSYLEIAGFANFNIEYFGSTTALEQLTYASNKFGFPIKKTDYDFGTFVDCIGGICGDSNHFWSLYKNGEASMVGAGELTVNINDKISWVYTSF